MSANLKNFGVRLSNVVRPIYNDDTHPSVFANDALGGLHIVRSIKEFETKCQQRLLIGMEVVSLDESTLRDDNGNIVSTESGGSPEIGKWRLIDATISCNATKFDCPLLKQYGSKKKCLLEHPNCRISSITNCKWKRVLEKQYPEWKNILNIPNVINWIVNDISLPYFKVDQLIINSPQFGDNINFFDIDGKINNIFLRKCDGQGGNVVFWNERILVDHSFYPENGWTTTIPNEVLNKQILEIGEKVEQVNIALMYNLERVNFPTNGQLRSFRLNNSKITVFDARNVNNTLEELNLDDNEFLEEIFVSDNDSYLDIELHKYPLKKISVRNCPNLRKIHITSTQVTTINLRQCIRLNRLYADNTPMVNIIPQEDYRGIFPDEDYHVTEDLIHYFFRRSCMHKIGFDNIYRALMQAHPERGYVIYLHEGTSEYSTGSTVSIAEDLGHVVSFDENQPF